MELRRQGSSARTRIYARQGRSPGPVQEPKKAAGFSRERGNGVDTSEEDRWTGRADGQGGVVQEVDGERRPRRRRRRREQIGKKEATRPRWNNWEEEEEKKKRMRCDYSILAESGWRERTPQKSWEGLKRAPPAPTRMIATRARVRAERREEGFGWGLKKGDTETQREIAAAGERRQRTTTTAVTVIPPSSRGLNAKCISPPAMLGEEDTATRAHSWHGRWSYRIAPGRLVHSY